MLSTGFECSKEYQGCQGYIAQRSQIVLAPLYGLLLALSALAGAFRRLFQRCQRRVKHGIGVVRIVDTHALILIDHQVVPQGSRLSFGIIANDDCSLGVQHMLGRQRSLDLVKFCLDFGLDAINVKVFGIFVAGGAGGDIGGEIVRFAIAHVAGHAGILDRSHMGRGLSGDHCAADAEDHGGHRTVMRAPMGAGHADLASFRGRECGHRLVTARAQVARTTIVGSIDSGELDRGYGGQRPIFARVGGVDLVTGLAVDAAGIRVCGLDIRNFCP